MFCIIKWLSNLWNLRKIFDKYLPKIKSLLETADRQQCQMENLRQEIINMKKDIAKLKKDSEVEPVPTDECPKVMKADKYYDPQLGVEYTTIEINGDKVSPDEGTVKE